MVPVNFIRFEESIDGFQKSQQSERIEVRDRSLGILLALMRPRESRTMPEFSESRSFQIPHRLWDISVSSFIDCIDFLAHSSRSRPNATPQRPHGNSSSYTLSQRFISPHVTQEFPLHRCDLSTVVRNCIELNVPSESHIHTEASRILTLILESGQDRGDA
jgi:hypothetical protein